VAILLAAEGDDSLIQGLPDHRSSIAETVRHLAIPNRDCIACIKGPAIVGSHNNTRLIGFHNSLTAHRTISSSLFLLPLVTSCLERTTGL
jgi:hypothetical protein